MTDREILALMVNNNSKGLDLLMEKYGTLVRYIISQTVKSTADIDEAYSDTFYKVWLNREKIDLERRSLKGYVNMVAAGCAVDKARSIGRSSYSGGVEIISAEEDDIGIELDYTDEAAKAINTEIIAACIRAMRLPDREIFIMRYYYKMAVKEIAERQNLPPKRVENILHRRKKQLKKELLKKGIIL